MDEASRMTLLEQENSELREEVAVLFETVNQLRKSINLLIGRYIVDEDGCEG